VSDRSPPIRLVRLVAGMIAPRRVGTDLSAGHQRHGLLTPSLEGGRAADGRIGTTFLPPAAQD